MFNNREYTKTSLQKYMFEYIKTCQERFFNDPIINSFASFHPNHTSDSIYCVGIHPEWNNRCIQKYMYDNRNELVDCYSVKTICEYMFDERVHLEKYARRAVFPQILSFRESHKPPSKCPLCRKHCDRFDIDHVYSFADLFNDFCKEYYGCAPSVLHYERYTETEKQAFETEWALYHAKHAVLRYLCQTCNIRRKTMSDESLKPHRNVYMW